MQGSKMGGPGKLFQNTNQLIMYDKLDKKDKELLVKSQIAL
jgi:hypothetical protein